MRKKLPMKLQFFAEPGGAEPPAAGVQGQQQTGGQQDAGFQFDYDKLASMIAGKQTAAEESVLRGYFKQQGLTKEQADQAISSFKQQQAANTPDVSAMQTQLSQAQAEAQQAQINSAATLTAVSLGIEAKTIPYVLKMADLSQVMGQDGKINEETLKNALNKVLEDVPGLKPQAQQAAGFQIGAPGGNKQTATNEDALKQAFGL